MIEDTRTDPLPAARERSALERLFRSPASRAWWLFALTGLLLFTGLGVVDLWTLEGRWGLICQEMLRSGDYVHPWLIDRPYYDKPLLSYWLMVGLARVLGTLDGWALRLPSAFSGMLAVWCTYRLGNRLFGREAGLLAGLMLATTFYFVFWGRVASADMMTVAGVASAVTWYVERQDRPGFLFHLTFFSILALTSLTKGLIGAVIPVLVLLPSLFRGWRAHLRWTTLLAALPAALLYLAAFAISGPGGGELGMLGGLYMVFRENVERFFRPFDHEGSIFTYFVYLPLFFLPWTLFFPFAVWAVASEWKRSGPGMRWAAWASLVIFAFLTASGSRRSYYVLPLLPFVALLTAGWVYPPEGCRPRLRRAALWLAAASGVILIAWFGVIRPLASQVTGMRLLAREVRAVLEREGPPERWQFVFWQGPRQTAAFYLSPHRRGEWLESGGDQGVAPLRAALAENPRTAIVTERRNREQVLPLLTDPLEIEMKNWRTLLERMSGLPGSLRSSSFREKNLVVFLPRLE